jgi:NurA-like 5'-3' nuclease
VKRKKIVAAIEQQILEEHAELHYDEHQHSRAYHSGLMDGLGFALKLLKPESSVISLTSVWYEDDPTQTLERDRERVIELQYIDMEDPAPVACYAGLFETAEAQ